MKKKRFNKREIFDIVDKHLRKQMFRAVNSDDVCQYRMMKDKRLVYCAIGILIPRENYKRFLEGKNVDDPIVLKHLGYNITKQEQIDFLKRLQDIHDQHYVDEWDQLLTEMKKEHFS